MKQLGDPAERSRSNHHLSLFGGGLIIVIMAAAGFVIWDLYENTISNSRKEMANLSLVLAEQIFRTLQAVDLVVQEVQEKSHVVGVKNPEEFDRLMGSKETHHYLVGRLQNIPQANSVFVVGAGGRLLNTSRVWPPPLVENADRDYYAHFREHNEPGALITAPVRNRATGSWVFFLARRINGPHDAFLGIVLAMIEARYFEEFYQAIKMQEGGSVAIFRRDGTLLVRYPRIEGALGRKLPPESPWYARVEEGGGTYLTPGHVGGVPRVVSASPVRGLPVVVAVTISEEAALADWRRQSILIVTATLCAVAGLLVLFWALARQLRQLQYSEAALIARNHELEASQARLERNEARFRDFAEAASDWFWEADTENRLVYLSPNFEKLTGLSAPAYLGKRRDDYGDTSIDAEGWRRQVAAIEERRPFRDFVFRHRQVDAQGRHLWTKASGVPVFGPDGRFCGYRGTSSLMTAQIEAEARRRELEAQLHHSQKLQALGTLAGGVAHDLNNTLVPIVALSKLALEELPAQSSIRDDIETVVRASERARGLVNQILAFSRKQNLVKREVDLAQVTREALQMLRASLPASIEIVDRISEIPPVFGDAGELHQVVVNLLTNAAQAIGGGVGKITVRLWADPEKDAAPSVPEVRRVVWLSVTDTGCGMDRATVDRVFEPFFTTKGVGQGTGLGLSVVHGIATGHGGTITVHSAPGEGSEFTLSLPALDGQHAILEPETV